MNTKRRNEATFYERPVERLAARAGRGVRVSELLGDLNDAFYEESGDPQPGAESANPNHEAGFRRPRHRPGEPENRFFRSLAASAAMWPDAGEFGVAPVEQFRTPEPAEDRAPIHALLVNAHPDDESESAALVYRLTHELGAAVDQVVVTNGEGGHQFAALAEAYYRLPLTTAANKRELLGQIRREELMRSSRILGIRNNYFLDQTDTGVTLNAADAFDAWNIPRIRQELRTLLQFEKYDLVVLLLPTADTHGHHQTVAALTLEAVNELDPEDRPATLGVCTASAGDDAPPEFSELNGYPATRTFDATPVWTFDRSTPLSQHRPLDYSVVVNWVINEHKSQGFFQMECSRRTQENFWLFEVSGEAGAARWRDVLEKLNGDSSAHKWELARTA